MTTTLVTIISCLFLGAATARAEPIDLVIAARISDHAGVSPHEAYLATAKSDKIAGAKLLSYARLRGIAGLEESYAKLIASNSKRCKGNHSGLPACTEALKELKRELSEVRRLGKISLTSKSLDDSRYLALLVFNEQAQNEVLARRLAEARIGCQRELSERCRRDIRAISLASRALLDLVSLAAEKRQKHREPAAEKATLARLAEVFE